MYKQFLVITLCLFAALFISDSFFHFSCLAVWMCALKLSSPWIWSKMYTECLFYYYYIKGEPDTNQCSVACLVEDKTMTCDGYNIFVIEKRRRSFYVNRPVNQNSFDIKPEFMQNTDVLALCLYSFRLELSKMQGDVTHRTSHIALNNSQSEI